MRKYLMYQTLIIFVSKPVIGTLGNAKVIITNKGVVRWDYIENLFKVQSHLSLKLGNKLSQAHVMWHQNKTKVKLAAQTLSSLTAYALLFIKIFIWMDFTMLMKL